MAKRINVKLIMDLSAGGLTQNEIANSRHFSKTSVSLVLKTARELNVTAADLQEMTPEEAYRLFFPEKLSADQIYELPDYEYVHEELKRVGVTLKLLWEEYRDKQSSVMTTTSTAMRLRSAATSSTNPDSAVKWTGAVPR